MVTKPSLYTVNLKDIGDLCGNVYLACVLIGKRAKQFALVQNEELTGKLADFAITTDNLEEITENREQIEISRYYESKPKPSMVALADFVEGKLTFRSPQELVTEEGEESASLEGVDIPQE